MEAEEITKERKKERNIEADFRESEGGLQGEKREGAEREDERVIG